MHCHTLQKTDKGQKSLSILRQLHHGIRLVWANHITSLAATQGRDSQFWGLFCTEPSQALQPWLMCPTESSLCSLQPWDAFVHIVLAPDGSIQSHFSIINIPWPAPS